MAKHKHQQTNKATAKADSQKETSNFSFEKYVKWLHLGIITVLFWFVYSTVFDHKPDLNGDNFAYYLLGKRIATGQGFTNATSIHHEPHTHFPPGYPVIIAGIIKFIADDQDTINFFNGLMLYACLLLLYFLVKRLTDSAAFAFVVTLLTALNAHLLRSSVIMMSEIPFLFLSMSAIFFLVKATDEGRNMKRPWLVLAVLLMAACYYTKTTAVALVGGAVMYFLFSKKWKEAAVVMGLFGLLIFPWWLRNKNLNSSHMTQLMQVNPYKPELGNLTAATFKERVENNFKRYISTDIPGAMLCLEANFEKPPLSWWLIGLLLIGLSLTGIYFLRDYRLFFLGYIGGTLAILLIWPDVWGGIRFILPLIPLAAMASLWAVVKLVNIVLNKASFSFSPYFLLVFVLFYTTPIEQLAAKAEEPMPMNYVNYFELAKWCKSNLPKDAVISARKADMFIYYADRTCIGDKPSLDDKEVLDFFRQNGVDYVVVEQLGFSSTAKYLIPAINKNPDKFPVVRQLPNPDTYLLKFTEGDR
ncbi:MAG: glycosyltransferase family 39 protein [Chitinophagales bacterium]